MNSAKILIVEDEGSIQKLCQRLLGRLGYQLTTVGCVSDAFAAIEHNSYDLLISDLKLPDGYGGTVVESFKNKYPNGHAIIMTGSITPNEKGTNQYGGVLIPYLLKPFKIEEFTDLVQVSLHDSPPKPEGNANRIVAGP